MSEENKKTIRYIFEVLFNEHRLDEISDYYCEDCTGIDPANDEMLTGHASVEALLKGYRAAFPDHRYKVHDVIGEGDSVCVRWSVGELQNDAGQSFDIHGISLCEFHDGKISRVWQHWDNCGFLKQMKAIPDDATVAGAVQAFIAARE